MTHEQLGACCRRRRLPASAGLLLWLCVGMEVVVAQAPRCAEPPETSIDSGAAAWYDTVTVTATRTTQDRTDVPGNVTVLDNEVRESAALTLDYVLRQVPGFATNREQSSIASSVSAQTVSLRGLGSSVSRTLVLFDGIPMNDAYGGWIHWAKAPRELLDRIEVVRGGGASAWGNLALGGVINLMTIEPSGRSLSATALVGDHETSDLTLALADAGDSWSGWVSGNAFDTAGYYSLRSDLRGPIDRPNTLENQSYLGKVAWAPSPRVSLRLSGDWWDEERKKGSPLADGSTEGWSAVANAGLVNDAGVWDFHLFNRHQDWANFSVRINADRTAETPSNDIFSQPFDALGANATWSRELGSKHQLVGGADVQNVDIEHHQDLSFRNGRFTQRADVEGSQQLAGAFFQDLFDPSPALTVQAGARFDRIRNYDGQQIVIDSVTGAVIDTRSHADNEESTVNPSLGAVYRANDAATLRGSVYTGFRAPNPAELYKGFRAGNQIVEPNAELEPEHLHGAELGADYHPSTRFFGRATAFWNELEDLILDTTIAVAGPDGAVIPPCGVVPARTACRQRNNIGRIEALGLELEGEYRPTERWSFSLSTLFEDQEVKSAPQLPGLVGKRLPQIPEQTVVLRVRFSDPALFDAMVQGRYVGPRFEDDSNTLEVRSLSTADVVLSRQLGRAASVFVGVENLFDQRYEVTRDTAGLVEVERRRAHIGLRYSYR